MECICLGSLFSPYNFRLMYRFHFPLVPVLFFKRFFLVEDSFSENEFLSVNRD